MDSRFNYDMFGPGVSKIEKTKMFMARHKKLTCLAVLLIAIGAILSVRCIVAYTTTGKDRIDRQMEYSIRPNDLTHEVMKNQPKKIISNRQNSTLGAHREMSSRDRYV